MIRPTAKQRAEMAAYIDAKQPGLLDDLGISRSAPCRETCRDIDMCCLCGEPAGHEGAHSCAAEPCGHTWARGTQP